jgi:hypothetical protein
VLAQDSERQGYVFVGAEVVEQAEFLENDPDPAAEGGQILAGQPAGIDPNIETRPAVGLNAR